MNIDEKAILEKIRHRSSPRVLDNDNVIYRRNGRFTVAIILTADHEIIGVGATLRSPKDRDQPSVAQQIAFARAVRDKGE